MTNRPTCNPCPRGRGPATQGRAGFTLAESLLAIALASIAGSGILLALGSTVQTTTESQDRTIALGIANQLVDEVLGARYAAVGVGPYQTPLGSGSSNGMVRASFGDTGAFNGYTSQPVQDSYGIELGQGDDQGGLRHPNFRLPAGSFSQWSETINVYYVSNTDPSTALTGSQVSNFRAVEVHVYGQGGNTGTVSEELARLRRVYAYVPAPQ